MKSGTRRKFVYAYYPEFDASSHLHGVGSPETAAVYASIDAAFTELLRRLAGTDTAVILTADHGFIDCPAENALDTADCPGLADLLLRPLTGERRVAFCHVLPGRKNEFIALASKWLEGKADVLPGHVPLNEGWFGSGDMHPHIADRIGDVVLMMREPYTVKDWLPGERAICISAITAGCPPTKCTFPSYSPALETFRPASPDHYANPPHARKSRRPRRPEQGSRRRRADRLP